MLGELIRKWRIRLALRRRIAKELQYHLNEAAAAACWISIEAAMAGFHKIPFTCNYLPGRAHVIGLWTFYAIAMLTYSSTLAEVEMWALDGVLRPVLLVVAVMLGWLLLRRFRDLLGRGRGKIVFFESDEPVVQRLGLEP